MDIEKIKKLIPHRYPFLLIDKVLDIKPGISITAAKCVTCNEPFFEGHFPQNPVMPGVLILESIAQAGAICVNSEMKSRHESNTIYLSSIEKARFKKTVTPGDVMKITSEKLQSRNKVWKMCGRVEVDGQLVASCLFSAMMIIK